MLTRSFLAGLVLAFVWQSCLQPAETSESHAAAGESAGDILLLLRNTDTSCEQAKQAGQASSEKVSVPPGLPPGLELGWNCLQVIYQKALAFTYVNSLNLQLLTLDVLPELHSITAAELGALLPSIFDKAFKGEL